MVGNLAVTLSLGGSDDFVVAFDASNGNERWSARIGPTYKGHGGSDDGPIATPAIAGDLVFAASPHGELLALDSTTGGERWRHNLVREFGATLPTWGFAASPLVEGQLVIVPTGGEKGRGLLAFDRSSGKLIWNASHAKATSYSSAVPGVIAGARQIIAAAADRVYAVAPADGRLLWSAPGPGGTIEVANSPIVLPDDRVLITTWNDSMLLKISRQSGSLTASEVWRSTTPRGANGPTIYRDGFLYGFAGPMMICVDPATGQVRWRERTGEGTLVGLGANLLFLSHSTGHLQIVRAAPDRYIETLRTRVLTPEVRSVTGLSVAGGRIHVRNLREIAAFAITTRSP